MADDQYKALFKTSWKDLFNNLTLFWPSIFMFFSTIILVVLFFTTSGLVTYLLNKPIYFRENPLAELFTGMPVKIIIFFIIYLVLEFILSAYFSGMKNGMAKDVVEKGSTSLKSGFAYANTYFLKVIGLEVIVLGILLPPIFIFLSLQTASATANVTANFFLIMFVFLFIIYFIYMSFNLIFVYPVLFFEKKNSFKTISKDFHYVKTHFLHTFICWVLIIGVFAFFYIAKLPFDRVSNYSSSLIIILVAFLAIYILEVVFSQWEHLFVMRAYIEGQKAKAALPAQPSLPTAPVAVPQKKPSKNSKRKSYK